MIRSGSDETDPAIGLIPTISGAPDERGPASAHRSASTAGEGRSAHLISNRMSASWKEAAYTNRSESINSY